MIDPEAEYLLRRAKEEAFRAIQAENPTVSAVHQELALRYSAKAVIAIANADDAIERGYGSAGIRQSVICHALATASRADQQSESG